MPTDEWYLRIHKSTLPEESVHRSNGQTETNLQGLESDQRSPSPGRKVFSAKKIALRWRLR